MVATSKDFTVSDPVLAELLQRLEQLEATVATQGKIIEQLHAQQQVGNPLDACANAFAARAQGQCKSSMRQWAAGHPLLFGILATSLLAFFVPHWLALPLFIVACVVTLRVSSVASRRDPLATAQEQNRFNWRHVVALLAVFPLVLSQIVGYYYIEQHRCFAHHHHAGPRHY